MIIENAISKSFIASLNQGPAPRNEGETAERLRPLLKDVVSLAAGRGAEIEAASVALKQQMVSSRLTALAAQDVATADPMKINVGGEEPSPLQREWQEATLRAGFAACCAGALDGIMAYTSQIAPRAFYYAGDRSEVRRDAKDITTDGYLCMEYAENVAYHSAAKAFWDGGLSSLNVGMMRTMPERIPDSTDFHYGGALISSNAYRAGISLGVSMAHAELGARP